MINSIVTYYLSVGILLAAVTALPAGVYVGDKGEVGASWGGYSASAGLNGGSKGGLHAEAGTPGGQYASAGLGGSQTGGSTSSGGSFASSGSSASSGTSIFSTPPSGNKGTFFDDIFNIPQSILKSVNDLLNKRGSPNKASVVVAGTVDKSSSASAGSSSSSSSSASSSADTFAAADSTTQHQKPGLSGSPTKYDQIFAIPQAALSAVAQLLNRL